MALVHCSFCGKETINVEGVCQYCGRTLKSGILHRKLRWNEAYGVVLIVLGISISAYLKLPGLLITLAGIILGVSGLFKRRVE